MKTSSENNQSNSLALKSGIWYTISNFLIKATSFLTTPIFARMMAKSDYGNYSNFATWISIMIIITGFDAHTSIIRYKNELKDDLDSYAFSALTLNSLITILCYGVCLIFKNAVLNLLGMDEIYLHFMFLYLIIFHAFNIMLTKNRAFYKYKMFVLLSALSVIGSAALSVIFVIAFQDKLLGRILGQYLPTFIMSLGLYVLIAYTGKKVKVDYWKKICVLCLPLIPHLISLYILSSSDKILITNLSGAEYTAIYSIAYSCVHILSILFDSMNKAWAPWLIENLHYDNRKEIRAASTPYFMGACVLSILVMLVGPELIWVLGGESFKDAIYCLPPLMVSTLIQVLYTMYVNIEFYCKKTVGTAIASTIAAIINIVLNIIFIPLWGPYAAAYTTLVGYAILLLIHYWLVKRLGYHKIYNRKLVFSSIAALVLLIPVCFVLYKYLILRYLGILLIGGITAAYLIYSGLMKKILKLLIKK